MSESLAAIASSEGKKLAVWLAVISSSIVMGFFAYLSFKNVHNSFKTQIQDQASNITYWFEAGDSFQIQRFISNIVQRKTSIYSIEVVDTSTNFLVARDTISPVKVGLIDFIDWNPVFTLRHSQPLSSGKGQVLVDSALSLWPLVISLLFGFIIYFVMAEIFKRVFGAFSFKLIDPFLKFSGKLESQDSLDGFMEVSQSPSNIQELNVFKKSLLGLGERIVETDLRNQELLKKEVYFKLARQVAHDIRSPISILEVVATIEAGKLNKNSNGLLNKAIDRIREISENLLDHGECSLKERSKFVSVPFSELLREVFESKVLEFSSNSSIAFDLTIDPLAEDSCVFLCRSEVFRVLSNLLNNAVEALEGRVGGVISLELRSSGKGILLEISDNGRGIPQENLSKIFEEGQSFFKSGGNGLGLSYARSVVTKMNGSILVSSDVKQGTIFKLYFPKAPASDIDILAKAEI